MTETNVVNDSLPAMTIKNLFNRDDVKNKFQEILGKKSQGFITSVLQIASSNELLSQAEPSSIYNAAMLAATLDLPLNNSLGFAYIIPFKDGKSGKVMAQFQIGYKGFIQLSQRSGQFKTISACPIFEGQLVESNPLTGYKFDFTQRKSETVIGYAGFFQLINGFEKTIYMTVEELNKHGLRFSQTFKRGYGLWKDDFHSMGIKTIIKLLLSKFAPLSIEMQKAVITDQSLINNEDATDVKYVDNQLEKPDKELERLTYHVEQAATLEELQVLKAHADTDEKKDLISRRYAELTTPQNESVPQNIIDEIKAQDELAGVNVIVFQNKHLNGVKEFDSLVANQKMLIGKKFKKQNARTTKQK